MKALVKYTNVDNEHSEQVEIIGKIKVDKQAIADFIKMCGEIVEERRNYLRGKEEQAKEYENIDKIKVGGTD